MFIQFLCVEFNSSIEYFTVMTEVQNCTPIQYVEVYNSYKKWLLQLSIPCFKASKEVLSTNGCGMLFHISTLSGKKEFM